MVQVELTHSFLKSVKKLPARQQHKLALLLLELGTDPFTSLLHTKPLSGQLAGHHSFRISREWRVIFRFIDAETILTIRAAHRKDIYR